MTNNGVGEELEKTEGACEQQSGLTGEKCEQKMEIEGGRAEQRGQEGGKCE